MRERIKELIDNFFLPRWIVLITDISLICLVFVLTYLLRFNLVSSAVDVPRMLTQMVAMIPVLWFATWVIKPHHGILRHTSVRDAFSVFKAMTIVSICLVVISYLGSYFHNDLDIPLSVIIIHYFISLVVLITFRFSVAFIYHNLIKKDEPKESMMIFGAGSMGQITKNVIEKADNLHYKLVGFIDDNPGLQKKKVDGLEVYSVEETFSKIIDQKKVKEIIIGMTAPKISKETVVLRIISK